MLAKAGQKSMLRMVFQSEFYNATEQALGCRWRPASDPCADRRLRENLHKEQSL